MVDKGAGGEAKKKKNMVGVWARSQMDEIIHTQEEMDVP